MQVSYARKAMATAAELRENVKDKLSTLPSRIKAALGRQRLVHISNTKFNRNPQSSNEVQS
jgi:hypothetical protein